MTIGSGSNIGIFANGGFSGGSGDGDQGGSLVNQGTITQAGAGSVMHTTACKSENGPSGTY